MAAVERLGVLGGTFDPVHIGHLLMAQSAHEALDLDLVLFVPAGVPPHKRDEKHEDARLRLAMVEAAVADDPRFLASAVDLDRPAPHYTVETLALLRKEWKVTPDSLYFILGSDSLAQLHTWYRPELIVREALLAVVPRSGYPAKLAAVSERIPEAQGRLRLVDMPEVGISSTLIREMVRKGRSVRYWVPESVERLIDEYGLYRCRADAAPAGD